MNEHRSEEAKNEDIGYWLDRVRDDPDNLTSKLWWADAIRNGVITANIKKLYGDTPITILDVPCGLAPICEFLVAERVRSRYVGIDVNEDAVSQASERVGRLTSTYRCFEFRQNSKYKYAHEKNKYDVVLCLDGPEHLVKDLDGLRDLFEDFHFLLRPSGTLFVSTPRAREDGDLHYPYCHDVEFSIKEIFTAALWTKKLFELVYHVGYRLAPENMEDHTLLKPSQTGGIEVDAFSQIPHAIIAPFITWNKPQIADSILYVFKRV